MKRLTIRVRGHVQNVCFRQSAKDLADELNLSGWARNDPDESMTIEAEGDAGNVDRFLIWCESGPIEARVDEIEHNEIPVQGELDFRIIT